jgi:3-hydroxyisobutyrate dehydrogenase
MLPSSPHVKQVYSGSIIPSLQKLPPADITQTLCIDSTTLDVGIARAVAGEINAIGAQMVDAPVSGGKSSRVARLIELT